MQTMLANTIPNIISVHFNPAGSDNHQSAVLADVVNKMQRVIAASKMAVPLSKEDLVAADQSEKSQKSSPRNKAGSTRKAVNFTTGMTATSSMSPDEAGTTAAAGEGYV